VSNIFELPIVKHLLTLDLDFSILKSDRSVLLQKVTEVLIQAESDGSSDDMIRQLLTFVGIDRLLPQDYSKFQPLVIEGMCFLLKNLPLPRLSEKITDQILLPGNSTSGDRICALINDMPTLQKLGQVICRSPGLKPEFKQALVQLEDDIDSISYESLLPYIKEEIQSLGSEYEFKLEENILAEGSVCAVVGAMVRNKGEEGYFKAILKIVKPAVRQNLSYELDQFDKLAEFLDQSREKWGLGDIQFSSTFSQVRWLLENEIDLTVEQKNLTEVNIYYKSASKYRYPYLFPCSTPNMTVMSRIEGNKITDVENLDHFQKRLLISTLANYCILKPIQDIGEVSVFHGDPHAGNIAYVFNDKKPEIIFYDWGMTGHLSRIERFSLLLIAYGIVIKSPLAILYAIDFVTKGQVFSVGNFRSDLYRSIDNELKEQKERVKGLLSTMERIFESLTYQGIIFPKDFLMFEKTLIALKGVMADIDPGFDRNDYIVWGALKKFYKDLFGLQNHLALIKEIFLLYRFSFRKLIEIQKLFFKMGKEFGVGQLSTIFKKSR